MKQIFFLIGMPGVGKTYWGEKLSAATGFAFTDLDRYIEQEEGKTIAGIFSASGEDHFRRLERQALSRLIDSSADRPQIIACGGGTPCYSGNLELMQAAGTVIYLRAAIGTLAEHLCHDEGVRPLLENGMIYDKLFHLLEHRAAYYEQAHYIVDAENLSVATFGEILRSCIKEH
jgi:shikimate kinase